MRKVREVGVRYTLRLGMCTLIPAAIFRYTRMAILEILPGDVTAPLDPDKTIRWATSADLPMLEAFGHKAEGLERRFAAGARTCVAIEGQDLLAYVWFHGPSHDEEDLGVRFEIDPGETWLFDAMVRPDQRGRGLYRRLLRIAARDLGREGVRRVWIAIDTANHNSLRAHEAAGARSTQSVRGLRILGLTIVQAEHGFRAAWTGTKRYVRLRVSSTR